VRNEGIKNEKCEMWNVRDEGIKNEKCEMWE